MKDLTTAAKKLDKVFEIAHIVFSALAIASLVLIALIGLTWVMGWEPEFIGADYNTISLGFVDLELAEAYIPSKWLVTGLTAFSLLVACRLFYDGRRGIGYIREILQPMIEEKPFVSIVSTNLKKLAKLSIVIGILFNVITLAEQIVVVFLYDLPGLLISEKITHVSGMFQIDLSFLIYWAILMLLSYVFQYGEDLQQLSDETL